MVQLHTPPFSWSLIGNTLLAPTPNPHDGLFDSEFTFGKFGKFCVAFFPFNLWPCPLNHSSLFFVCLFFSFVIVTVSYGVLSLLRLKERRTSKSTVRARSVVQQLSAVLREPEPTWFESQLWQFEKRNESHTCACVPKS